MAIATTSPPPGGALAHGFSNRRRFDAVTVLTVFIVLLLAVPSQFVVAALGSIGGPATILALGAAVWWGWHTLQRTEPEALGRQPVRVAGLVFLAAGVASYAAAMLRAIPAQEMSTADSGMVRLVAWTGILLVATDGIRDGQRLEVFLRRLVLAGGLIGALGLLQFLTGVTFVDRINLPGLSSNQLFAEVQSRGGFVRSTGTSIHPLEYATVLAMTFPLALTQALERKGSLVARWWPATVIAAAGAISVSRSTILCLAVGVLVMMLTWSPAIRRRMLAAGSVLAVAVFFLVPGMIGVLNSLFRGISNDSSALSRWESLDIVWSFFERAPLFGRGLSTFLTEYRILDNQYVGTLVEMGIVGLSALLAISITAFFCAEAARRTMTTLAPWARALSASIAAGATGFAFFDGFAFPQSVGLFFVVAGTCGAAWRIARSERGAASSARPVMVSRTS